MYVFPSVQTRPSVQADRLWVRGGPGEGLIVEEAHLGLLLPPQEPLQPRHPILRFLWGGGGAGGDISPDWVEGRGRGGASGVG